MRYKQSIYQDWKDGEITHSGYHHMSEHYERQIAALREVLKNLHVEREELQNGITDESSCLVVF
ncbi:hypothetical protein J25TS5_45750 [Paenibacillus faecis]|uniref:hypothetical protein n=1 Tax=Paenibacillus faecis TaxID=862114 RepID=UPI001B22CB84|nr:hypothetical protein [Paenibacillus faecis]GIO87643.1 hypothetical protein J25TS5_45750 [Paenibacillus faecis]